jgi:hypothetical protein
MSEDGLRPDNWLQKEHANKIVFKIPLTLPLLLASSSL